MNTDKSAEEVVKALEYCSKFCNDDGCKGCHFNKSTYNSSCAQYWMSRALDCITSLEQQLEAARFVRSDDARDALGKAQGERIARLEKELEIANEDKIGVCKLYTEVCNDRVDALTKFHEAERRAEAAERRAAAAVEDLTAALTCDGELIICEYCKNNVICKGKDCDCYESGNGDIDGNFKDWKWTCEDFSTRTCSSQCGRRGRNP